MSCGIVDDIEDILKSEDDKTDEIDRFNLPNKSYVVPKNLKKFQKIKSQNEGEEEDVLNTDSIIPGQGKIFVKTWGCTHNTSDSEYMAGQLASYGYTLVDNSSDADLWVLNSCTVKNPAEDHFKNYIDKARDLNKFLVLAGCVPQGAPNAEYIQGLSIIGVQQIDRIVEVVEETFKGNSVRLFGKKKKDGKKYGGASLNLPKIRKNPLIEIISINTGCLNQCTYCKTKHARGELGSYEPKEIIDRIKQSFEEGVCEVWLTSEDTGAYGKDIGVTIVDLLWQIVEVIPENCRLRIGMTNPPYILEHLEEMAKILNHDRVYSFLHIPVQSGSDAVLTDMKREYCVEDFCKIVDYLNEKVPGIHIITDVICGFPTEELEDFQQTVDLIEKYKFQSLFINQFFPRPGTPAAKMRQIATNERKRRTKIMSELFHSYSTHDHKLGNKYKVLVTEISHDSLHYVSHNRFYDQILIEKCEGLMGKMIEVEIIECGKFFMKGKILNKDQVLSTLVDKPIVKKISNGKVVSTNNDCCGGSCSCEHDEQLEVVHNEKEIVENHYINSKVTYYAIFALSLAYLTRFTWKYLIKNK